MLSQKNYRECLAEGWSNDIPHCEGKEKLIPYETDFLSLWYYLELVCDLTTLCGTSIVYSDYYDCLCCE